MKSALERVKNGWSVRKAARFSSIPVSTLRDRVKGLCPITKLDAKPGPGPKLGIENEEKIIWWIKARQEFKFIVTWDSIKEIAIKYDSTLSASNKWIELLKQRHPTIVIRTAQSVQSYKTQMLTEIRVKSWLHNWSKVVEEYKLEAQDIFNMDETGF